MGDVPLLSVRAARLENLKLFDDLLQVLVPEFIRRRNRERRLSAPRTLDEPLHDGPRLLRSGWPAAIQLRRSG